MSYLLDQVLGIINCVKDNDEKLQQILDYLACEIIEEADEEESENCNPIDELPEKYKSIVNEIAQYIDMGMLCFLNPETDELDFIPQEIYYDANYDDDPEKVKKELIDLHGWEVIKFLDWENPIGFEPLHSSESFRIMEKFAQQLSEDEPIRSRLFKALRNRKPFANFGRIIDDSDFREDWFEFKQQWLDNLVARDLLVELENRKEDIDEI